MNILKSKYKIKNVSGEYDTVHFETSANQVITNESLQFVTREEKTNWNNKSDVSHSHSNYSDVNHNHDKIYSPISHTHDAKDIIGLSLSAENITVKDAEDLIASHNVEAALAEIVKKANANHSNVNKLRMEMEEELKLIKQQIANLQNEVEASRKTLQNNVIEIRGVL